MNTGKEKLWQIATIFTCLLFCFFIGIDAFWGESYARVPGAFSDSYYIASFARNIATGNGWASWLGFSLIPLDLNISTGPVVFLPLSVLFFLGLPAKLAIPLAALTLNFTLLILLLRLLSSILNKYQLFLFCASWLSFLFSFQSHLWYLCLGETSSVLLLAIATTLVSLPKPSIKRFLFAGIATSSAVFCKLLAVFGVAILALAVIWQATFKRKTNPNWIVTAWLIGLSLPPFFLGIAGSLKYSFSFLTDYVLNYLAIYLLSHGQISPNPSNWNLHSILTNFSANIDILLSLDSPFVTYLLLALSILLPITLVLHFFQRRSKLQQWHLTISLLAACYLFWFYFLGLHQQHRYFYIGGALAALTLSAFLATSRLAAFSSLTLSVLWLLAAPSWPATSPENNYLKNSITLAAALDKDPSTNEYIWLSTANLSIPFAPLHTNNSQLWYDPIGYLAKYTEIDRKRSIIPSIADNNPHPNNFQKYWLQHINMMTAANFMDVSKFIGLSSTLSALSKDDQSHLILQWNNGDTITVVADRPFLKQHNMSCHSSYENAEFIVMRCSITQLENIVNKLVGRANTVTLTPISPTITVKHQP